MYEKHAEVLALFFAGSISKDDHRLEAALPAAIDLMRAAEPKDAAAERAECQRIARAVICDVSEDGCVSFNCAGVEKTRAAARAEGYAQGHEVARASIIECGELRTKHAAAQAQISELTNEVRRLSRERDELQDILAASRSSHEQTIGERRKLETKLANLRTAAVQHLQTVENSDQWYDDCDKLLRAIEASK